MSPAFKKGVEFSILIGKNVFFQYSVSQNWGTDACSLW